VNTQEIMQLALDLGGFDEIPADSGVWVEGSDVRRVLVGIDVGPAELKIAHDLGFDAVIAHHPIRRRGFAQIFERHWQLMREAGVPDDVIRAAIEERVAALKLSEQNANDDHVVSVARLLRMPFLNVHLPLDEYTRQAMIGAISGCQRERPGATVEDVAKAIGALSSFRRSAVKPLVVYGSPDATAGRVVVSIAAGTNGGYPVASAYLRHGVDTVVYMHIQRDDLQRLCDEETPGNIIITGHMPGDSVGLDAFVRMLRARDVEVTTFSGVDTPLE
jgi:hypothetical protein